MAEIVTLPPFEIGARVKVPARARAPLPGYPDGVGDVVGYEFSTDKQGRVRGRVRVAYGFGAPSQVMTGDGIFVELAPDVVEGWFDLAAVEPADA